VTRLAARDDDHAFLAPLVDTATREARMRLEEEAGPSLGALLGGSLARGEGTVWRDGARVRALSDIDLAMVFAEPAQAARARAIAPATARGLARRLRARGLLGPVDLGVYALADLPRQGPRPGTLEMRRSGRVLWGPSDLAARFPELAETDVPRDEAVVLLENRGIELLHAWPGDAPADDVDRQLVGMYAGLKAVVDGAFALVVATGRVPATQQARQAALEILAVEGRSETLDAVLPDFMAEAAFWGRMKLAPDPAAIALHLGAPDARDPVALARRAWRAGARAHLAAYRALGVHAVHRARLRRRLRRWWEEGRRFAAFERDGRAAWSLRPWPARARLAVAGAPEHQLAACGAALLAAWAQPGAGGTDWRSTMARCFPGALPSRLEWDPCRTAVVRLWDTMQMGGVRTAWDDDRPETAGETLEDP
jgi:predicted nucleotidyltransferase